MWNEIELALNESATRVIAGIANLLPGLVALTVALLISLMLASVAAFLLRRSLRGIDFDTKTMTWGMVTLTELSPGKSPSRLIVRIVFWGVILVGFMIGITALDTALTSQLLLRLFAFLPNFLAAVVLLLVGNVIARFLARGVLIGSVNMNVPYARLLSVGVKWLVIVLTSAMALDHLGIGGKIVDLAFAILFGGIVLALALAVGLGSKDLVSRSLERQSNVPAREEESFRHY